MRGSGATKDGEAKYYAVENERVPWPSNGSYNGPYNGLPPAPAAPGVRPAAVPLHRVPSGQQRPQTSHHRHENAAYGAGADQYGRGQYRDERDVPFGQPYDMPTGPPRSRSRRPLPPQPPTIGNF